MRDSVVSQTSAKVGEDLDAAAPEPVLRLHSVSPMRLDLIPIFDVLGLLDHYVFHTAEGSFVSG